MNLAGESRNAEQRHSVRDDPAGAIALTNQMVDDAITSCLQPVIGMGIGVPAPLHAETPAGSRHGFTLRGPT